MQNITRIVIAAVLLAAGFVAGTWWESGSQTETSVSRAPKASAPSVPFEYQAPPPKITVREAADHRENHYEQLEGVNDVLDLPTDFSQTEALYTIAGRADAVSGFTRGARN